MFTFFFNRAGHPDPDVNAHWMRMSSTDNTQKDDIASLILGLKDDGLWDKLDDLCVVHDNEADSLLGLKGDYDSSNARGCTFTTDRGFTTDRATSEYINTAYIGNSAPLWQDNSHSFFVYQRTCESRDGGTFIGAVDTIGYYGVSVSAGPSPDNVLMQSKNFTSTSISADTPTGFIGCARTSSTDCHMRINALTGGSYGSEFAGDSPEVALLIGGRNTNGTGVEAMINNQFSAWGYGAGLTSTELSNLRTRIQTYMDARGAGV